MLYECVVTDIQKIPNVNAVPVTECRNYNHFHFMTNLNSTASGISYVICFACDSLTLCSYIGCKKC